MPINIIVKSGGGKVSDEEMAHHLRQSNREDIEREKATYKERSRQIRKDAENISLPDGMRVRAVYDAKTFFRHEEARKGCMSDESYLRELRRDNEEMRLD